MLHSFITFLLLTTPQVHAQNRPSGHEVLNGGSFVVCSSVSSTGAGVFSLDRIEGENLHSLPPARHFENFQNEDLIVEGVIDELNRINPARAAKYREWHQQIVTHRFPSNDLTIAPVEDSGGVMLPPGCALRQGAVFFVDRGANTVRFAYDQNLWQSAPALDRAYLLLHEIVYREAKSPENSHLNSMAARYLTAYLMSQAGNLSDSALLSVLYKLNFESAQYRYVPVTLMSLDLRGQPTKAPLKFFQNSSYVEKAVLANNFALRIGHHDIVRKCVPPGPFPGYFKNYVEFYYNGKVKHIVFEVIPGVAGCDALLGANSIVFSDKGEILETSLVETPGFSKF